MHMYRRRTLLTTMTASMMGSLLYDWGQPRVSPAAAQAHWRWCHQCECLWFNEPRATGVCPAGGSHAQAASPDYTLTVDGPTAHQQAHWRWCHQCACLWWQDSPMPGVCSAGGPHAHTGSGDYSLTYNAPEAGQQANWRWCVKCGALWYNGSPTSGLCPANGSHKASTGNVCSGNYSLFYS
jgi:hypothetical protein